MSDTPATAASTSASSAATWVRRALAVMLCAALAGGGQGLWHRASANEDTATALVSARARIGPDLALWLDSPRNASFTAPSAGSPGAFSGPAPAASGDPGATSPEESALTGRSADLELGEPSPDLLWQRVWTLAYATGFSSLSDWTVVDGQTQNNDHSVNLARNVTAGVDGLTIAGRREDGHAAPFTSGEILGKHLVLPNYFRAEVTGRFADVAGVWPCLLWFRPANSSAGEIDLMEWMGGLWSGDQRRVAITMHNQYGPGHAPIKKPLLLRDAPWYDPAAPHTYTLEKIPGSLTVWIDGHHVATFTAADAAWWPTIMENPDRTWYPRITLQIGAGAATKTVPDPAPGFTSTAMTVTSLRLWTLNAQATAPTPTTPEPTSTSTPLGQLGDYNGSSPRDRSDLTTLADFGRLPDVASTYYLARQPVDLAYETARINRGTSPNLTVTTKGTQLLAGIAAGDPTALAWLDSYVASLKTLAAVNPAIPVYATLDHEFRVKVRRGQLTSDSARPEIYGQALSVFYDKLHALGLPNLQGTYWLVGSDRAFEGAVGAAFTTRPDVILVDPYAHRPTDTITSIAAADLAWSRAQSWYAGQPLGFGEFGMPVRFGDTALATFYTAVRPQLRRLGVTFAVLFNRSRDNNHKITTGAYPEAVAAFSSSLAAKDALHPDPNPDTDPDLAATLGGNP